MPVSVVTGTEQGAQRLAWPRTPVTVPWYRSFTLWQGLAGAQEYKIVLSAVHLTAEHPKSCSQVSLPRHLPLVPARAAGLSRAIGGMPGCLQRAHSATTPSRSLRGTGLRGDVATAASWCG